MLEKVEGITLCNSARTEKSGLGSERWELRSKPTLLIVDDDSANLNAYAMGFRRQPYRLLTADNGVRGLEIMREEQVDVILTDMKMPGVAGLDVVKAAAEQPIPPAVIVVTAYGTIENAVEAMRLGALDYITKPVNLDELRAKVAKAMEVYTLRARNDELQGRLNDRFKFEGVVGVSAAMQSVIEQSRMVAGTRASALIEGESGTGKELIARAIHFNSPRANGPFVPIHCAAIPETLLESELFGSEKGAFTALSTAHRAFRERGRRNRVSRRSERNSAGCTGQTAARSRTT